MAEEGHGDDAEQASKKPKHETSCTLSSEIGLDEVKKVYFLNYLMNINCLHYLFFLYFIRVLLVMKRNKWILRMKSNKC